MRRRHLANSPPQIAGVGQCIAIATGVRDGLGKQEHLLNQHQIASANKVSYSHVSTRSGPKLTSLQAQYAADWFYLLALCLAKISVLLLLHRLAVDKLHKKIALSTVGVVSLWALAGIVALAARCGATLPWDITSTDQCINLRTFWIGMAPVDILSELVVITIPVLMMIPVQVAVSKKAVIVVAFLFRVLVIAATIARLFYIQPIYPARNFTFDTVNADVMNQIVLSFSITTACIPCLKPFLDAFDSGQMAVVVDQGRIGGSHSGSRSYPLRDLSYGKNLAYGNNKSMVTSGIDNAGDDRDVDIHEAIKYGPKGRRQASQTRSANGNTLPNNGTAYPINEKEEASNTDNGSVASSSKSDQMIIKKNISYTVQYEDANPQHEDMERQQPRSQANSTRQSQQDLHDQFIFHDYEKSQSPRKKGHPGNNNGAGM